MSSYTKGPWFVDNNQVKSAVIGGHDGFVSTPFGGDDEELAANAHLIAAAPELLEVMENIWIGALDWHDEDDYISILREDFDDLVDVVNKAKGLV